MPWMHSSDIDPPLTDQERGLIDDGQTVVRQTEDGIIVVNPRHVATPRGVVTGAGVTFGPDGEDAFFHPGGHLV
jgi:hypothetical protein